MGRFSSVSLGLGAYELVAEHASLSYGEVCALYRNECVTYTHGMGELMGWRGLWDNHGPRVCVV